MTGSGVVGRDVELARIARFVGAIPDGPAALFIDGDAGIGKTTIWRAGRSLAKDRGHRVLSSQAAEPETTLAFTTLADLLDPVLDDVSALLPEPQRRALEIALLRTQAVEPVEQRAVSMAALGALRVLAEDRAMLIAVDDLQWVDASSARVLAFGLRRLEHAPVGFLASIRTGELATGPSDVTGLFGIGGADRLTVGPLTPEMIAGVIRQHLQIEVPRPMVLRIHRISSGNPLHALEIARGLRERGDPPEAWEELPVPHDLGELLGQRLRALPEEARRVLQVASAMSRPRVEPVCAIAGEVGQSGLRFAETAGVVDVREGKIRFDHPLLASIAYGSIPDAERRSLHARLADAIDDPEESVLHRALAAEGPDESIALALDQVARRAWLRGAADAASRLVALARRLTPDGDVEDTWRRGVAVALYSFSFGDVRAAKATLTELVATSPPGSLRARSLRGLALLGYAGASMTPLLEQALEEAGDDGRMVAMLRSDLAWNAIYEGDLHVADRHAGIALRTARRPHDPAQREPLIFLGGPELTDAWATADALRGALEASAMVEALAGRPSQDLMGQAMAIDVPGEEFANLLYGSSAPYSALLMMWAGQIAEARELLEGAHTLAKDRGWETVRWEQLAFLSELESRAGNWPLARSLALEAEEIVNDAGLDEVRRYVLFPKGLVEALQGDVDAARADAIEGIGLAEEAGDRYAAIQQRSVLGFTELSRGDHRAAMGALEELPEWIEQMGVGEPGAFPYVPDAVETLVGLGELSRARTLTDWLEERGRALDRALALATAGRCRGLLAAIDGERDDALEAFEGALLQHARVAQPFDLARTLLSLGEVQRRFKQRRDARGSLHGALAIFEELGSDRWSERTRAELERLGATTTAPGGLTATELRVAELAARGKTNREIAAELFISVKTVEANVSRVFQKLGIRSRRHIGVHLDPTEPD